jgi:hypothetical protein
MLTGRAKDLTEEEKNHIRSLSGVNKYNMFELKTFEVFDFDNDRDDVVDLWLEDNNFYEEDGKWNSDSMFTITVPDYLINDNGYLKISFGKIGGDFEIDGGRLVSLKGCPEEVGGNFEIINNLIENLRNLPYKIGGGVYLVNNRIKSLKGLDNSMIGTYINVSRNQLKDLEGCPDKINGTLKVNDNELTSLKGGPFEISGSFYCNNNDLKTLYGAPRKVKGEIELKNAGPIPETEMQFYEEVKQYNNYYEDLLKWIVSNDRLEKDLDEIDWPEGFLHDKGNIIRSIKGINKYNLGLELNPDVEESLSFENFLALNESIDIVEVGKTYPHTSDTETQGGLYYELSDDMIKELGIKKAKDSDKALISEIHFDTRNIIVEMYGYDDVNNLTLYDELDYTTGSKSHYTINADELPEYIKSFIKDEIDKDIRADKSGKVVKRYNL